MLQIIIPTHGRITRQVTLSHIPEALRDEVLLVTSTEEDKEFFKKNGHKNTIRANANCIAAKRQWIVENVKAKKILMLDDDMGFQARCPEKFRKFDVSKGRWKITNPKHFLLAKQYATPDYFIHVMEKLDNALDAYGHVGLSSRMGNDLVRESFIINGRMMHAIGYDRKLLLKENIRFDTVKHREDFHVTLSLLRKGYANFVFYDMCCSPGSYGAPGGASTERTLEESNRDAEVLATLHPGLVRVVDKEYKNIPRKEVVVSWKKAYNHE